MFSRLPAPTGNPPTKVIFDGVEPGSELAQQLFHQHQGEITRFHTKARQSRDISGQDGYATQQALPGGDQFRYTYNNGLEVIHVRLTSPVIEGKPTPRPPVEQPWDFALVEITIPNMTETTARFSAFTVSRGLDEGGYAEDSNGTYNSEILRYSVGDDIPIIGSIESSDQVSSLRVDLRKLRGSVEIDLYGYVLPYDGPSDVSDGTQLAGQVGREWLNYPLTPKSLGDLILIGDKAGLVGEFPEVAGLTEYTGQHIVLSEHGQVNNIRSLQDGSILWIGGSTTTLGFTSQDSGVSFGATLDQVMNPYGGPFTTDIEYWGDGYLKTQAYSGAHWIYLGPGGSPDYQQPPGPVPEKAGSFLFQCACVTNYYAHHYPTVPQYVDRTGTLGVVFFRGEQIDDRSALLFDVSGGYRQFTRWELTGKFPRTFKLQTLAAPVIQAIDPPTGIDAGSDNHFGMPRLGTVKLDIEHGTATWEAA